MFCSQYRGTTVRTRITVLWAVEQCRSPSSRRSSVHVRVNR